MIQRRSSRPPSGSERRAYERLGRGRIGTGQATPEQNQQEHNEDAGITAMDQGYFVKVVAQQRRRALSEVPDA